MRSGSTSDASVSELNFGNKTKAMRNGAGSELSLCFGLCIARQNSMMENLCDVGDYSPLLMPPAAQEPDQ
jgi:hypothetical protein